MSIPIRIRRPLVVLGVVLSLFLGVATIRAAAEWTAASSPLGAKPPSIESLGAALATERARSAALVAQLDQLEAGSTDLTGAINAARDRITADAVQADGLRASLTAAKAKLAALEASIRRARAPAARGTTVNATRPAGAPTHESDGEVGDGD